MPEPGEASGDPGAKTAALKNAIRVRGIALESVDDLDGALGTSSGGCIRLLNGLSPATEFTTLVKTCIAQPHIQTASVSPTPMEALIVERSVTCQATTGAM